LDGDGVGGMVGFRCIKESMPMDNVILPTPSFTTRCSSWIIWFCTFPETVEFDVGHSNWFQTRLIFFLAAEIIAAVFPSELTVVTEFAFGYLVASLVLRFRRIGRVLADYNIYWNRNSQPDKSGIVAHSKRWRVLRFHAAFASLVDKKRAMQYKKLRKLLQHTTPTIATFL
jgi:hypothetical protein